MNAVMSMLKAAAADPDGWQAGRVNGYRRDLDEGSITRAHMPAPVDHPREVGSTLLFIERRPKADRYVFVLLIQLAELDRDAAEKGRAWYERRRESLSVSEGSDWINRLKAKIQEAADNRTVDAIQNVPQPAKKGVEPGTGYDRYDDIPTAYYAVTIDGVDKFYRVRHRDGKGQWEGRHFVNVDAQASDEFHPVKVWNTRKTILDAIRAAGPDEAMAAYGRLIGRCGRCHRTLTDENSRAIGIGPDCLDRM